MNEHEPRVGDVVQAYAKQAIGVVLDVIYPQGTGDRGRVVFHWSSGKVGPYDSHPLPWVRSALANGDMKILSRAESVNSERM